MTLRSTIMKSFKAASRGFEEEGGSRRAINGALLAIASALIGILMTTGDQGRLDEETK